MGPELIIAAVALPLWAAGWVLLARLHRAARPTPGADTLPADRVSVVIPARNEEHNLPVLLESLRGEPVQPLEVIVVDDGSTDGTAAVAAGLGARVVSPPPLPDGWRGKPWACQHGAAAARGEWLLFLDADTRVEPGGLAAMLAFPARGAASVAPWHAVRRPYEQLSAFFNLLMVLGTVPHGLFGQMLLVDRASYQQVGGHEPVKGRILENLRLAGEFRAAGVPVASRTGRGSFTVRMYPNGLPELVEGWTKGFAAGAGATPRPLLLLIVAWLSGLACAAAALPAAPATAPVYLAFAGQAALLLRHAGAFRWTTALVYPIPLAFYFAVFTRSLLRSGKPVTWKGREIPAD